MNEEPNRTWENSGFKLHMWYRGMDPRRDFRVRMAYEFYDGDELIFAGDDFYPSPLFYFDSDESVAALLAFLAVRPGDTDDQYFKDYTPRQLAWADERAEELSAYICDLEGSVVYKEVL